MSSSSSSNDVNSRIDKLESSLSRMETMMAMFLQQQGRGVVGEGQGPDLNTSIRVEGKEANSVEVEVIDKQDGKKKVMGSKRKLTPTKTEMTTPKVKRTGGGKKKVIRRGEDGDYIIDSNNNSKASTPIVGNSTAPRRGRNNITLLTCDDDDVDMNDIETLDSIRIEECDGGVNTPSAAAAGGVKDDDKEGEEHNFIPSLAYPWPSTLDDAMVTLKECNARLLNDNNNISWVTWDDIKGKEEEGQRQEEEGDLSPVGPITTAVVVADDRDEKIAEPKVEVKKDVQLEETQALEKEDEEVSLGMIFPDDDDDDDGDKGYTSLSITPTTTRAIVDNDKEGGNISSGKRRARGEGAEEEKAIPQQSSSSQPTCAAGEAAVTAKDRKKEWFQSLYKSRGAKVAACRYYARGICDKGDDCEYSHDTKAISVTAAATTISDSRAAAGAGGDVAPAKRPRISKALDKVNKAMEKKCPYLGTVNRNMLDFDFEKVCSVTLSNQNVYACLVCGKYYSGRGQGTCAYTHALEKKHYVFINLKDTKVYCIPDGYEIIDASLDDIRYNLNPTFTTDMLNSTTDKSTALGFTLDGRPFLPGCVGLNAISGGTDYLNVIVQILQQVVPLRNALLTKKQDLDASRTDVTEALAELFRKTYNAKNFKGVVSPHEFLQVVSLKSKKHFFTSQRDPAEFLTWLLNHLRLPHKMINKIFKGEILVKTCRNLDSQAAGDVWEETTSDFLTLTLDLPDAPLFKDTQEFIPQVPMISLLDKFNGETIVEDLMHRQLRKYSIKRLPPYLVFVTKRFKKNNFTVEKNPTLVRFPLKGLDMKDWVHPSWHNINNHTKYDLVGLVSHSGQAEAGMGVYKAYVLHSNNVVLAKPGEEEEDIFGVGDENMKDRDLALAGIEIG
ncbi:hypothetical protein FOL47_004426 [Perkinsus chesapeaki]|uniref:U4/U6.U5 tri-snRNP-associated protein 2 n=1 Tax=Perkinsus chesapeaki TaxID=330153 RepID=A0A7J6M2V2_PERCH|nr:hypothetical protein FOL47_004426 [Perkinsus chesapeaki]